MPLTPRARESGVVLLVVLFFALLLSSTIATFLRRSTVDAMIVRNRDQAARADALARGGIRLVEAVLIEDRIREEAGEAPRLDGYLDAWARLGEIELEEAGGARLRLRAEDAGARLNLNTLIEEDEAGLGTARQEALPFLLAFFEKMVEELPLPPGERGLYDPRALAENLLDWMDGDEERRSGGPEDDFYQSQQPPYRAANGPLLSLDELRLVEGFDAPLVETLRPYITVYPFAPGGCGSQDVGCGVNLNTAPPHVLALLYYDDGVQQRLADEDTVRRILRIREEGGMICAAEVGFEQCTPVNEIITNAIFPPPTVSAEIFTVTAEAQVGDTRRALEAVVDRSQPGNPRLLSWRLR